MYFTSEERVDGFGSQFQTLLHMIYYAAANNAEYIHIPIRVMEHNYANDPSYVESLEEFMCVWLFKKINEINSSMPTIRHISNEECRNYFQQDVDKAMSHSSLTAYKSVFLETINKNHYSSNKFIIALHIRRGDVQSTNSNRERYTSNEFYLEKMKYLSETYADKDIQFHIYSEGSPDEFNCFQSENTILHLNEDVRTTFIGLITSQVLVQSKSSFSYVAGLLSNGTVYHIPFWHPPKSSWILL
jgi:hypothetical protein